MNLADVGADSWWSEGRGKERVRERVSKGARDQGRREEGWRDGGGEG